MVAFVGSSSGPVYRSVVLHDSGVAICWTMDILHVSLRSDACKKKKKNKSAITFSGKDVYHFKVQLIEGNSN